MTGRKDGTLRVHVSNKRMFLGNRRLQCKGSQQNPRELAQDERDELRRDWRDDEGWPIRLHGLG